jgi:hypothetical protein
MMQVVVFELEKGRALSSGKPMNNDYQFSLDEAGAHCCVNGGNRVTRRRDGIEGCRSPGLVD